MKNYTLLVVDGGNTCCLGTDATSIKLKDDELTFVYDDNEREDVYHLDPADEVIIKINR